MRTSSGGVGGRGLPTLSHLTSPQVRSRRVAILLTGTVLMSMHDLLLTLLFATSVGMVEVNPIARFIMQTFNSPYAVAIWKVVTVAVCVAIIASLRRTRLGEIASWCAFLVLLALCLHWMTYVREVLHIADDYHMLQMVDSERFVLMTDE